MLELAGSNERRLAGSALKENAAARFTRVPDLPIHLLRIVRRDIVSVRPAFADALLTDFLVHPLLRPQ